MSFRLQIRDEFRGRVTFSETLHVTRPKAVESLRSQLILLGLRNAVRWDNETPYDVDSCDQRSVNAFLNSPESITRFIYQLRECDDTDEAGQELIESLRSGRQYEWPIDEEDEIALLLLAANDQDVFFSYRISET